MSEFFQYGQPGHYLLLVLLLLCLGGLMLLHRRRGRAGRAEKLQNRYAVMTQELLGELPDEKLINAVIANLMAKLDETRPDPLVTLPQLSRGRCAVYFSWMLVKEIEHNGAKALKKKPANRFVDIGVEGLQTVGATASAQAIVKFLEGEAAEAVTSALAAEQPLILCRDYIRANPEEFID